MAKESLGEKLEKQVQNLKGGLKGVADKLTAEDTDPRTVGMAGPISGARPPVHREREQTKRQTDYGKNSLPVCPGRCRRVAGASEPAGV